MFSEDNHKVQITIDIFYERLGIPASLGYPSNSSGLVRHHGTKYEREKTMKCHEWTHGRTDVKIGIVM